MAAIVVCGGGVIGLATAMMLARDGHEVTVLEADASPVPTDPAQAWEEWARKGVAQFHQPHNLFARARQVMDDELPGLTDELLAAGGIWIDPIATMPPGIEDRAARPGDDRFRFVNARRPVIEAVVAQAAERTSGVSVRRGVAIDGLEIDVDGGVPRVSGVAIRGEGNVRADLVVDAMGRRSKLADWLDKVGAPPTVESEDSGFVYYTRFFRGPEQPAAFGPPLAGLGSISVLTLRGDNDTWSLTIFGSSADTALRALRDPTCFDRVAQSLPLQAHWGHGEPLGGVEVMAGVLDKHRRFVLDGRPIASGVVAVSDAWACTNPSAGRGMSVGLIHAQRLRNVVREVGWDDAEQLAQRFGEITATDVEPFYRNQIAADRVRVAEMEALRTGAQPPAPDAAAAAVATAMTQDATVFRAMMECITCLALPQEALTRPEVVAAVAPFAGQTPSPFPGPSRAELEALLIG